MKGKVTTFQKATRELVNMRKHILCFILQCSLLIYHLVYVSVPTYAASTNICAGQGGNFVAAANITSITCEEATNGEGALGTNAPQTGGVSFLL